jgi:hypothetical protein
MLPSAIFTMSKTSCFRAKRDKNPVGFILLTGLLQRSPKRQIGERKVGRGGTVYEMNVGPRKAARADYENNLTVVKKDGGVAHFFHNGLSARRNNLAFLTLWQQTIVKMASGFFHNGPAGWRLDSNPGEKPVS